MSSKAMEIKIEYKNLFEHIKLLSNKRKEGL